MLEIRKEVIKDFRKKIKQGGTQENKLMFFKN